MSKFTFILSFVIVYVCCIAIGLGDSTSSGGTNPGTNMAQGSPKNARILSPAASRLYRLLRRGLSGDEDDLFTEDENYLRKRQGQYDDYGHMRFGKRTQPVKDFDDYGHMRFGK